MMHKEALGIIQTVFFSEIAIVYLAEILKHYLKVVNNS